jgi:Na+/H+ antiporter NhaD/arsenite permease-like protein
MSLYVRKNNLLCLLCTYAFTKLEKMIALFFIFVLGYAAIAFEEQIHINKAASAILTGVLCWTTYILSHGDAHAVNLQLENHLSEIAGILFFLLSAMVIVELIDAHDGFDIITEQIQTTKKRNLIWIIGIITFFLSAILDNMTTTIVIVSLMRKMIADKEDRWWFAGMTVIAANAGGAWSPLGDVTTTMLWIGGQVSPLGIILKLFVPSLICMIVPLWLVSRKMKGHIIAPLNTENQNTNMPTTAFERNAVFGVGVSILLLIPIFKTVTHLPPFMGILLGLGLIWLITEWIHIGKVAEDKHSFSVVHALRKVDTPSILFFLGILLAVAALESAGQLRWMANLLTQHIGNETVIVMSMGALSAVVDNVPLVAAAQGMYPLSQYPMDHFFWEFLAFCTGTGGSCLIIGSAAGVAAMGMEKIDFFWYLKRISGLAISGYLSGAAIYLIQNMIFH